MIKRTIEIITSILCVSCLNAQLPVDTFHVSRVGKDKKVLLAVFAEVQRLEKTNRYGTPLTLINEHSIDGNSHIVYKTEIIFRRELDPKTGKFYMAPNGFKKDSTRPYLLVSLKERDLNDGDTITDMWVVEFNDLKLVDHRKMRTLEEFTPQDLSRPAFIRRLKNGESWLLKDFIKKRCIKCLGDGQLNAVNNYAQCPACKGQGYSAHDRIVKW